MLALVLLGFLAASSTAARYDPYYYYNGFQGSMNRFWENFNEQMNDLGKQIENSVKNSFNRLWTSKIVGDKYKITVYLKGFHQEDIAVTVNKGNLVIQAIHNVPGEPSRNYLYETNLPHFVDENGSWYYNNGILTIIFPITQPESEDATSPNVNNENDGMNNENDENDNENNENKDLDDDVISDHLDNSYDTGN